MGGGTMSRYSHVQPLVYTRNTYIFNCYRAVECGGEDEDLPCVRWLRTYPYKSPKDRGADN